jgi:ataxin-3
MADEDMELQAVLQASLMASGGEDSWTPPAASAAAPTPPLHETIPPTQNRFAAPGAFPDDEGVGMGDDEDVHEDAELSAERQARELEAAGDAVGAGMARSQAKLARFQREQAVAARGLELFGGAGESPAQRQARERRQREHAEEEEMMRRAIEESRAMAEASGSGSGHQDDAMEDVSTPSVPERRTYDDDDEELQAALRASLESAPPGLQVPDHPEDSISAGTVPRSRLERAESVASVQSTATYKTESDAETEDGKEQAAPQESMEEMRKKRLARFGA